MVAFFNYSKPNTGQTFHNEYQTDAARSVFNNQMLLLYKKWGTSPWIHPILFLFYSILLHILNKYR